MLLLNSLHFLKPESVEGSVNIFPTWNFTDPGVLTEQVLAHHKLISQGLGGFLICGNISLNL